MFIALLILFIPVFLLESSMNANTTIAAVTDSLEEKRNVIWNENTTMPPRRLGGYRSSTLVQRYEVFRCTRFRHVPFLGELVG